MKPSEAVKVMATLAAAYPQRDLASETIEVYAHDLADLDAGVAAAAVERLRRTSRFFPTISEIREAAAELVLGAPPSTVAWRQALAFASHRHVWGDCPDCDGSGFVDVEREEMCHRCGSAGRVCVQPEEPLHPTVHEAYELTGDALFWRETPAAQLRKAFFEAYAEVKRTAILGIVAPPLPELVAGDRPLVAGELPMPELGKI